MCGISGVYNFSNEIINSEKILKNILKIQNNRGPDDRNIWISECKKLYLGHNRLSIIDLSKNASQPFVSIDQNYIITFNGEIYNFQDIKADLIKKNIQFKSKSDTEVILESYKYWGIDFVNKLRGMFSFVIWDKKEKKLILARDPFGIKPLYYSINKKVLYFASQVSALLSINEVSNIKLGKSICEYYLWGNVEEPNTLYRDISSIERGSIKIFDKNFNQTTYKYADIKETIINSKKDNFKNINDLNEKLSWVIRKSVKNHLVADVPITFSLSSGIDSNILLSSVEKKHNRDVINSLTLDFPNKINESKIAKKNSIINNINHIRKNINIDEISDLVLKYYNAMDMPTNDGLNNYLVSYYAKKNGSKILVSGIGGDEFFFGYPSFTRIPIIKKLSKLFPSKKNIKNILYLFGYKSLNKLKLNTKFSGLFKYNKKIFDLFMLQRCIFMPDEIGDLINKQIVDDKMIELHNKEKNNNFENDQMEIMYYEIKYYLCSKLLRDADWASMSNSIELRTPFVDWFLFKDILPILKSNFVVNKKNLLNSFKNNVPRELFLRKKSSFEIPHQMIFDKLSNNQRKHYNPLKNWSLFNYENFLLNEEK